MICRRALPPSIRPETMASEERGPIDNYTLAVVYAV
jgi:hypothetical protein